MQRYEYARRKADVYLPAQILIVSKSLNVPTSKIQIADDDLDRKEATDLLVGNLRVSLRVREMRWLPYAHQFTIRTSKGRDGSELDKIKNGLVGLMLYGYGSDDGDLVRWNLINLAPVAHAARDDFACVEGWERGAGTEAEFVALPYVSFPDYPPLVVASSHPLETPLPKPTAEVCECRRLRTLRRFVVATGVPQEPQEPPAAAPEQALDF